MSVNFKTRYQSCRDSVPTYATTPGLNGRTPQQFMHFSCLVRKSRYPKNGLRVENNEPFNGDSSYVMDSESINSELFWKPTSIIVHTISMVDYQFCQSGRRQKDPMILLKDNKL